MSETPTNHQPPDIREEPVVRLADLSKEAYEQIARDHPSQKVSARPEQTSALSEAQSVVEETTKLIKKRKRSA